MPNYVKNLITFEEVSDEMMEEILETIKNDDYGKGSIDFNKIIPMLKNTCDINASFNEESQNWSIVNWGTKWNAMEFCADLDKLHARKLMQNFKKAGDDISMTTAREVLENEIAFGEVIISEFRNILEFSTAWSPPIPILEKLTQMYPDARITHQWADDDFGVNVGTCEYQNGDLMFENIPDCQSKESYEMASQIIGFSLEELGYKLTPGGTNYEYINEEDMEMKEEMKDYYETSDGPMEVPAIVEAFIEEMEERIKVVIVKPMEAPAVAYIESGLNAMQDVVCGYIEEMMPFDEEVAIVCNEEGKLLKLDLNRAIRYPDGKIMDIIAGTFFMCGASGENFSSLTEEQIHKYYNLFKNPEVFISINGKIQAIAINK